MEQEGIPLSIGIIIAATILGVILFAGVVLIVTAMLLT
jgi:hypothetical protein